MNTRPIAIVVLGSNSDIGRERSQNQDSWLCYAPVVAPGIQPKQGWLYAVADGMGGYAAGEVASKLAVETLIQHYAENASDDLAALLQEGVTLANQAVYQRSGELNLEVMGTTLVCAAVRNDQLYVAHVGDSRAYLLRDNTLKSLTRDHSLISEQIRQGYITEEEARDSDLRGIVTRALGMKPNVQADIAGPLPLHAGDTLLLCSDGVCGYVPEDQIRYILQTHRTEPQAAADFLVEAANAAGGFDNATAVVISISRIEQVALESDGKSVVEQPAEAEPLQAQAHPKGRNASRSNTETFAVPHAVPHAVTPAVPPITASPTPSPASSPAPLPADVADTGPMTASPTPANAGTTVDATRESAAMEQTSDRLQTLPTHAPSGLPLSGRGLIAVAAVLVVILVVAILVAFSLGRNRSGPAPASGNASPNTDPPVQLAIHPTEGPALPVAAPAAPTDAPAVADGAAVEYTIAVVPQVPFITLTQMAVITAQARAGVPSAVTVTFRTNATIVEPSTFNATVELGQPDHAVRVELAPLVNFDRQEQVKIEVLAEADSAGEINTWTVGAFGLPTRPGLRTRSRLTALISLKPTRPVQLSGFPVRLTIRWQGTGAIPGDFEPDVSP